MLPWSLACSFLMQGHSGDPNEVFIRVGPVETVQQQVLEEVHREGSRDDDPPGAVAGGHSQHRRYHAPHAAEVPSA